MTDVENDLFETEPAVDRVLSSARMAGVIVLAVPVLLGAGLRLFPNYDARPEYFVASYSEIVAADVAFPVSLLVLTATALLLGALVSALRRAPQSSESQGAFVVAVGAFGVSAVGLLSAAVSSVPVWLWSRQVRSGVLTFSDGANQSQPWASTGQTLILILGLGGLLAGFTALGVLAFRSGWMPAVAFWLAVSFVVAAVVGGFALTLVWIALGLPAILWTLMVGGSLVIRGRYEAPTSPHDQHLADQRSTPS